jgi:uncharacterized protein YciW
MRLYVAVAQFFIRGGNSEASRLAPIHTLLDSRNTVGLLTETPSTFSKFSRLARACHVAEDSPETRLCCYSGVGVRGEGEV